MHQQIQNGLLIDFQDFWEEYPRKVGKYKAQKTWRKMTLEEQICAIEGLRLWKQTVQWHQGDGQFIPYASTFLNQRRWEDEPWVGAFNA